jgi:hypothetical protein
MNLDTKLWNRKHNRSMNRSVDKSVCPDYSHHGINQSFNHVTVTNLPRRRIYRCTHPHQHERQELTTNPSESRRRNPNGPKCEVKSRGAGGGGEDRLPGLDASAPAARRRIPERRPRLSAVAIAVSVRVLAWVAAAGAVVAMVGEDLGEGDLL